MHRMEANMLEKYLVEYCAPTLAALKTASLFAVRGQAEQKLMNEADHWNEQLSEKGIFTLILNKKQGFALVYVYRRNFLERDLRKPGVFRLLLQYGYTSTQVDYALARLFGRLLDNGGGVEFPHEIGLFLGYPLADVAGFIENSGHNCKCTGCWKVYGNERGALRAFARFERCSNSYLRMWREGQSIWKLAVEI